MSTRRGVMVGIAENVAIRGTGSRNNVSQPYKLATEYLGMAIALEDL